MQIVIRDLAQPVVDKQRLIFQGQNGRVLLSIHGRNIFSVFYQFDENTLPEEVQKGVREICAGNLGWKEESVWSREQVEEHPQHFSLTFRDHEFRLDKITGNLTVFRGGKLIHGGRIGTEDTVLPRFPVRAQVQPEKAGFKVKLNFRLEPEDVFFGLGEKSGLLNKRNRAFKMFNRDALGYDAGSSDPLYKSIPFFMKYHRKRRSICGLFFPSPCVEEVNFGVESIFYYYVRLEEGPFGYYLFTGDDYKDILRGYTQLTGRPTLPPLYTFGYFGSSMNYTEEDDAEQRILDYFRTVEEHRIPCEGMYISSGYTKFEDGKRYPFMWNRDKFKDPEGLFRSLARRGYRFCCNVKPGFLESHPFYCEIAERGFFIKDAKEKDHLEYFWGGDASLFDFLKEEAREWWRDRLKRDFLDIGIVGIWNDNNEFEIEDESVPRQRLHSLLTLLMVKTSFQACRESFQGKRPWIISRSGCAGLQRYACTWTGDNVSDFHSLAFNTLMGLNLGLSGLPFFGHDIGGFFGPRPGKELLIRWCQSGVLQPRFLIHSWNDDGIPTEPWTYPDSLKTIAGLIRLRYRFMPYIYNTAVEAAESGTPLQRPLGLEFPLDGRVEIDDWNYLFGPSILFLSAVTQGLRDVRAYLPEPCQWYDPEEEILHQGGQTVCIHYPLEGFRYLVKAGSIIPTSPGLSSLKTGFFSKLEFCLYPGADVRYAYYEDDGLTDFKAGDCNLFDLSLQDRGDSHQLDFSVRESLLSQTHLTGRRFAFVLPKGFCFDYDTLDRAGRSGFVEVSRPQKIVFICESAPESFSIRFQGSYAQRRIQ